VSAATQTYYASFDAVVFKLPIALRARIEAKIDEVGARLGSFPHHRLKAQTDSDFASATTGLSMHLTSKRTRYICWRWAIGVKFIEKSKQIRSQLPSRPGAYVALRKALDSNRPFRIRTGDGATVYTFRHRIMRSLTRPVDC